MGRTADNNTVKTKRTWWKRVLATIAWAIFGIALLLFGTMMALVSILTPERLTPLVSECATRFFNAEVKIGRAELSLWHSCTALKLDIDSLQVISHALNDVDEQTRAQLPCDADTLLTLGRFYAGLNVPSLLLGNVKLYDVVFERPMVNIVKVDDETINADIMPETSDTEFEIPNISIRRFSIVDALPIKYFSLSDSLELSATIKTADLIGEKAPVYTIAFDSNISSPLLEFINTNQLEFGINGSIDWDQDNPSSIALNDFTLDVDILHAKIDCAADFKDDVIVNSLKLDLAPIAVSDVMERLPKEMLADFSDLQTDAKMKLDMELSSPYNVSNDLIPSMNVKFSIPDCKINYEQLQISDFGTTISANVNGKNMDATVIKIDKLVVDGMGLSSSVTCTLSSLMSDPSVAGEIKGEFDLRYLPSVITDALAATISGRIVADTQFKLHKSYLSQNTFHKIYLDGSIALNDFNYRTNDASTRMYTHNAVFKLGTSRSVGRNDNQVDSLLAASIQVDSCYILQDNTGMRIAQFKAGIGCSNQSSIHDSTSINPIGGMISMKKFDMESVADSMRIGMRDLTCFASIRRFQQQAQVPELVLRINASTLGVGDKLTKMLIRDGSISFTAHLRPKQQMPAQIKAAYDDIEQENPDLLPDSIYVLALNKLQRKVSEGDLTTKMETLDFGVNNSFKTLLLRWSMHGSIKAKQGRLFTPYFPLNNQFDNIDFSFTTDSVMLKNLSYRVGRSDFLINGTIGNIKRALLSRQGTPLSMDLSVRSDTIDVNQLVTAAFVGASYSDYADKVGLSLSEIENEAQLDAAIAQNVDTTAVGALLIPTNIEANILMSANNILYSDMLLHDFSGGLFLNDGAVNLHELSAQTDIGELNLSALYTAPTKEDMRFGFGMQIRDFYIERFMKLFPALDTIMPLMNDIKGIINADVAATTDIDSAMNFVIPSLHAVIKIEGDSLVLLDSETFRTVSKWLLFKDKNKNMIDSMSVELIVENSQMELFPFKISIDRYQLGVMGQNDLAMNFDYHISVLKSPIPFKFGINIKGNMDNMKIRLGRAKFKEDMVGQRMTIADTTRINLLSQIENVFRRGVRSAKLEHLDIGNHPESFQDEISNDTISASDSLLFINEGLLPAPPVPTEDQATDSKGKNKKNKKSKN